MKKKDGIVKTGGVAKEDAETGDVTRDTYGFGEGQSVKKSPEERISEADRAAAARDVPGVAVPGAAASERSEDIRENEFRRAEITGDRTASRRDVRNLQTPNREQARGGDTSAGRGASPTRNVGRGRGVNDRRKKK